MLEGISIVSTALNTLFVQLINLIPKLIVALIIWVVGDYLLRVGVGLLRKINIKGTTLDNKLLATLSLLVTIVGKVVLVLTVLDYLGIGRTLIAALANGLAFSIAIALGLAFGRALEDDAKRVVTSVKKLLNLR